MKKTRIAFLLCLLMVVGAVLTSCGGAIGTKKWDKVLDGSYKEAAAAAAQATKIAALSGKEVEDNEGELIYFVSETEGDVSYTVHTVYNFVTDKTVYTATDSKTQDTYIKLDKFRGVSYFTVETETYPLVEDARDYDNVAVKLELRDAAGEVKHSSTDADATVVEDDVFLIFENVYFLPDKDAGLVKSFEKGPFAELPADLYPFGDKYFMNNVGATTIIYDKNLKVIFSYVYPGYAEPFGGAILSEDKVLIQYRVPVDVMSDKYDVIDDGMMKYELHMMILDIVKGKSKEIDCDYIMEGFDDFGEEYESMGIKEDADALCYVYPIVDKRVDEAIAYLASVSESGKVSVFKQLNDFYVTDIELVYDNIWEVETTDGKTYFVNEKFEILGEVGGCREKNEKYLIGGGKVYDYALNELLDYEAKDLSKEAVFPTTILFKEEGEIYDDYYLFVNGALQKLTDIAVVEEIPTPKKVFMPLDGSDLYVIGDLTNEEDQRAKVYNRDGKELLNLKAGENFGIEVVHSEDGVTVLLVEGYDAVNEKDTVDYYVVK